MAQTQRHPSRDERPTEWESVGKKHVHMHPGGMYEHQELADAKSFWHSEGNPVEGHHVTMPSQGRLFDPDVHEGIQRLELGAKRMPGFDAYGDVAEESKANSIRNSALASSVIPTSHLQPRQMRSGGEAPESRFVVEHGLQNKGALGHYTGPVLGPHQTDYVTIDPEGPQLDKTTQHELGHRHHLATRGIDEQAIHHPQSRFPDPVMEAHADAYVDRYGGPGSPQVRSMKRDLDYSGQKFKSYQYTGYSTRYQAPNPHNDWTQTDRALYAGTRAHYSETGEHTNYLPTPQAAGENQREASKPSSPTLDATIHSLLSNSPHAAQAMRQTGLKDVGQESFRRHRDRQLMGQGQQVQGALFNELRGHSSGKVHGYSPNFDAIEIPDDDNAFEAHFESMHKDIDKVEAKVGETIWPHHMSHNQFGERPRTQADVHQTLGVRRYDAKSRGFESM